MLQRAVYQRTIWYTTLQAFHMVPSPEGLVQWRDRWKPIWMTLPEEAKAYLKPLKECAGRCKCRKAKLPCTECSNN